MEKFSEKEKWGSSNSDEDDDEDEEETLSLCDLPVIISNGEKENKQSTETRLLESQDFDFGSWGGSILRESEMCVADEVFFQGQILPLRLSVSSENGLPGSRQESRCGSRSESMEHCSSLGFTSLSSRSNSSGSHNSSTITSSTTSTTTYKPKLRNPFHSHPSPKPQILFSGLRPGNVSNRSRQSTIWDIFRMGLVRAPEIELQELKLRNKKMKKRSFNSRSSSSSSSSKKSDSELKFLEKKKTERILFESCRCSVDAVETVIIKNKKINGRESKECKEEVKEKEKNEKHRKQALYQKRTFEWLKELSIVDVQEHN